MKKFIIFMLVIIMSMTFLACRANEDTPLETTETNEEIVWLLDCCVVASSITIKNAPININNLYILCIKNTSLSFCFIVRKTCIIVPL